MLSIRTSIVIIFCRSYTIAIFFCAYGRGVIALSFENSNKTSLPVRRSPEQNENTTLSRSVSPAFMAVSGSSSAEES